MITIVGLGSNAKQITLEGDGAIRTCKNVFLKTALTPTVNYFVDNNIEYVALDFIFETADDFDALDNEICNFLVEKEKQLGDICFCVNGSGIEDRSVVALSKICKLTFVYGVDCSIATCKPCLATTTISAYELLSMKGFDYDTRGGLCINDIDNEMVASDIKLVVGNLIGEEEKVFFGEKEIFVYEIDRQKTYNYTCSIFCPPLVLKDKKRFNFVDLYNIMQVLRGEGGCPWDKAQSHKSIRQNAIEEAYELANAIDNEDIENLIEESGDVVLQSMFHCVIGEDCGEFNLQDAMTVLCQKLIFRHTHIFGNVVANNEEEALSAWNNAKAKEKSYDSESSKMKGIAEALPSLMRAKKVQSIAKKSKMDFDDIQSVIDKINEELNELLTADKDNEEMEGGDLLFAVVNLLRWKDISPEVALNRSINKFCKRFEYVEKHCPKPLAQMSATDLDILWREAKIETCKS